MSPVEQVTEAINLVALTAFFLLLGAVIFSMIRRVRDYRQAKLPLPILLKRGLVLFIALGVLGGETAILRAANIILEPGSLERLVFIIQSDLILLGAMAYYTKAELFDLDDPDSP